MSSMIRKDGAYLRLLRRKTGSSLAPITAALLLTVAALTAGCGGKTKEVAAPAPPPGQAQAPAGPATTVGLTPEQRAVIEKADAQGPAVQAANNATGPQGK